MTEQNSKKDILFGKTLNELKLITESLGFPAYTAKQIALWLYKTQISSIDEMTNLSKKLRNKLNELFVIGVSSAKSVKTSSDGTIKYLFETQNNKFIETAFIPEEKRNTLCVSSQVGCKMACTFCMTGKQGFQNHLSTGEILNQLRSIPESKEVSNIVFMGMGEPLDNLDSVLKTLEILKSGVNIISCPTCGRCRQSLEDIVDKVKQSTKHIKESLTIAIMGCEVNGPGEASHADAGIAAAKQIVSFLEQGDITFKVN